MILLLTGEHGHYWLKQVRSALGLGLRPSAHILALKNPRDSWTRADHSIALAFQAINDETCPECGHPVWICRSSDNGLQFTVRTDVCYVSRAKETSKKKLKPGEFIYVRPEMRNGSALPDRDAYYAQLAEDAAIHSKARTPNR